MKTTVVREREVSMRERGLVLRNLRKNSSYLLHVLHITEMSIKFRIVQI
jgi:hypothetical protein